MNALAKIPDGTAKLVLTSPPYNVGKSYEKRVTLRDYLSFIEKAASEVVRILSPTGSLCWQVGNHVHGGEVTPLDIATYPVFRRLGLKLRNRIVWRFGHGLHAQRRFSGRYETLMWFTRDELYTFNLDEVRVPQKYPGKRHSKGINKGSPSGNRIGKNPSDYWEFVKSDWCDGVWNVPNVKANHPEKTVHPCQFPIELAERCVLALSNPGDTVLDPFVGSGTTMIAGLLHERKVVGIEKEWKYVKLTRERIEKAMANSLPRRELGRPIYEPRETDRVAQIPGEWR